MERTSYIRSVAYLLATSSNAELLVPDGRMLTLYDSSFVKVEAESDDVAEVKVHDVAEVKVQFAAAEVKVQFAAASAILRLTTCPSTFVFEAFDPFTHLFPSGLIHLVYLVSHN